ncbi:MAG: helix-turn-helix domain-containing protein [Bacilli bacterium]|nr:helix-turn-helix domain-containing protein [Bacilli bacterium]
MDRDDIMPTEFVLYNASEDKLFENKSKKEKEQILPEMVRDALIYGYKPVARKYYTYPATVRRWVRIYQEYGEEGLKLNKRRTGNKEGK